MSVEIINCTEEKIDLPYKVSSFENFVLSYGVPKEQIDELKEKLKAEHSENYKHAMPNFKEVILFYSCLYALVNKRSFIYSGTKSPYLRVSKTVNIDSVKSYVVNFSHQKLIDTLAKEGGIKNRFKRKGNPTLFIEDFPVSRADDTVSNRYLTEISSRYEMFLCRLETNHSKTNLWFSDYMNDPSVLFKSMANKSSLPKRKIYL